MRFRATLLSARLAVGTHPLAWLDEVLRECVRSNLVRGVSPAFGNRFALGRVDDGLGAHVA
jgi:hypothetical protein